MRKRIDEESLEKLKLAIVKAMQDKKAEKVVSIDLRKLNNPLADMFIICEAASDRQVEAIADFVENEVKLNTKERPAHKEGYENKEWILLDYFNIIVHVFQQEKREFFALERLWGDGEIVTYN